MAVVAQDFGEEDFGTEDFGEDSPPVDAITPSEAGPKAPKPPPELKNNQCKRVLQALLLQLDGAENYTKHTDLSTRSTNATKFLDYLRNVADPTFDDLLKKKVTNPMKPTFKKIDLGALTPQQKYYKEYLSTGEKRSLRDYLSLYEACNAQLQNSFMAGNIKELLHQFLPGLEINLTKKTSEPEGEETFPDAETPAGPTDIPVTPTKTNAEKTLEIVENLYKKIKANLQEAQSGNVLLLSQFQESTLQFDRETNANIENVPNLLGIFEKYVPDQARFIYITGNKALQAEAATKLEQLFKDGYASKDKYSDDDNENNKKVLQFLIEVSTELWLQKLNIKETFIKNLDDVLGIYNSLADAYETIIQKHNGENFTELIQKAQKVKQELEARIAQLQAELVTANAEVDRLTHEESQGSDVLKTKIKTRKKTAFFTQHTASVQFIEKLNANQFKDPPMELKTSNLSDYISNVLQQDQPEYFKDVIKFAKNRPDLEKFFTSSAYEDEFKQCVDNVTKLTESFDYFITPPPSGMDDSIVSDVEADTNINADQKKVLYKQMLDAFSKSNSNNIRFLSECADAIYGTDYSKDKIEATTTKLTAATAKTRNEVLNEAVNADYKKVIQDVLDSLLKTAPDEFTGTYLLPYFHKDFTLTQKADLNTLASWIIYAYYFLKKDGKDKANIKAAFEKVMITVGDQKKTLIEAFGTGANATQKVLDGAIDFKALQEYSGDDEDEVEDLRNSLQQATVLTAFCAANNVLYYHNNNNGRKEVANYMRTLISGEALFTDEQLQTEMTKNAKKIWDVSHKGIGDFAFQPPDWANIKSFCETNDWFAAPASSNFIDFA